MITYELALSPEAMSRYLTQLPRFLRNKEDEISKDFQELLDQHRIIWSDGYVSIINSINPLLQMQIEAFIASRNYAGGTRKLIDQQINNTFNEWIYKTVKVQVQDYIMIYNGKNDDVEPQQYIGENIHSVDESVKESVYNLLKRNSNDFSTRVEDGKDCIPYAQWLADFIANEKEICIFDPYIVSKAGFECFSKYLSGKFPKDCVLYIYAEEEQWLTQPVQIQRNIWNKFAVDNQISIHMILYKIPPQARKKQKGEHDRHIFLPASNMHMIIGRGIQFLDVSGKTKGTEIFMKYDLLNTAKKLAEEYKKEASSYRKEACFPLKKK